MQRPPRASAPAAATNRFRPRGARYAVLANLEAIGLTSAPLGFKPDKVWSYELGEKFRDNEGRMTINSAGYFENWQHIQQNIPLSHAVSPSRAMRALPTSTARSSRSAP